MRRVAALVAIVLVAPLLTGAVDVWAVALCLIAISVLASRIPGAWFRGPSFTLRSLYGIVLVFTVTLALQLLPGELSPAPHGIWSLASEALDQDLPARAAVDLSTPLWQVARLMLYALVFWVALAVGSDRERANTALRWAAWGTAALVAMTFFLYLADERALLWSERTYVGMGFTHGFVNRNTAASFLGTFLLLSLGLLIRSARKLSLGGGRLLSPAVLDQVLPAVIFRVAPHLLVVLIFAVGVTLTASRAGVLLTGLSALFLMSLILAKSQAGSKMTLWALLVVLGVALLSLQVWGTTLSARLAAQGLESTGRMEVFSALITLIGDYPWLGVGLGAFTLAFPAYRPVSLPPEKFWNAAHSTPLEITVEMGIPFAVIFALFWLGLFVVLIRGVVRRRIRFVYPAVGSAVWLLATLHSMVDFPMQAPGHTIAVLAVLGVCIAQTQPHRRRR